MDTLDFKANLDFNEFPPTSLDEWEAVIEKDLKGKNYKDVLNWNPENELEVLPFYRREHLSELAHPPEPVRDSAGWTIFQPVLVTDISEANQTALNALENGASGLYFYGEPNVVKSESDLEQLLENIQIEIIGLKFGSGLFSPEMIEILQTIINKKELNAEDLDLSLSIDPFSNALLSGKLPSKDAIQNSLQRLPFHLNVDVSLFGNAGANIIQQNAFALAAGNELLGMSEGPLQLNFTFSTANNYFPEIGKLRAFRLMWQQVLDSYESDQEFSIYSETALWNKAQNDAHNNMLRATTEAMSAVLGGADGVTVLPYDHHFDEPTEFSNRIARNVQLILQEEAYLDKVTDPGSGSYYIETLTEKIAKESWNLFQEIERKGGFYECLKSGFIQDEIQQSRERKIEFYKEKKETLVGVNKYQPDEVIQDLGFKIKDYFSRNSESDFTEIEKIEPLNMEVELQKGDA